MMIKIIIGLIIVLFSITCKSQDNNYIDISITEIKYESDCDLKDVIKSINLLNNNDLIWITNTLEILSDDKNITKEDKISVLNNTIFTLEKFNNSSFKNVILDLKIILKQYDISPYENRKYSK